MKGSKKDMQTGVRERWLLLCITLLGSGIIIGSEVNRLPPEPQLNLSERIERANTIPDEPLTLKPQHDASQVIAKVTPVLETL
jgi:hypothetical protein